MPQGVPIPVRSLLTLIASVALVVASTIYRFRCPERVQEFSETRWVEEHNRPRILYIADKISRGPWQWPTLVFSLLGGGVTVYLMIDLQWLALSHIAEPRTCPKNYRDAVGVCVASSTRRRSVPG